MRQVTQRIKDAFEQQRELTVSNTSTDGHNVWLFGNKIIKREEGKVYATLAGWNTVTTRERVNGITGAGFHQVAYRPMLNGEPVSDDQWIEVG
jgi:hypothetical protein